MRANHHTNYPVTPSSAVPSYFLTMSVWSCSQAENEPDISLLTSLKVFLFNTLQAKTIKWLWKYIYHDASVNSKRGGKLVECRQAEWDWRALETLVSLWSFLWNTANIFHWPWCLTHHRTLKSTIAWHDSGEWCSVEAFNSLQTGLC